MQYNTLNRMSGKLNVLTIKQQHLDKELTVWKQNATLCMWPPLLDIHVTGHKNSSVE